MAPCEPALLEFDSVATFVDRHRTAANAEQDLQLAEVSAFNELGHEYTAYVVKKAGDGYHVCVLLDCYAHLFPEAGRECRIAMNADYNTRTTSSVERSAHQVLMPSALGPSWHHYTEFYVARDFIESNTQTPCELAVVASTSNPDPAYAMKVKFFLRASSHTLDAELHALKRMLTFRQSMLNYYITFTEDSAHVIDLQAKWPAFFDPSLVKDLSRRKMIQEILDNFNKQQRAAHQCMKNIPFRTLFLPGSPGSGKTHWALKIALMAQICQNSPILFMMDLNKTLDDVAKRMANLYKDHQMPFQIVRLGIWPVYKTVASESKNSESEKASRVPPNTPDFFKTFWRVVSRYKLRIRDDSTDEKKVTETKHAWVKMQTASRPVITLDEAACNYLCKHRADPQFAVLVKAVEETWNGKNYASAHSEIVDLYAKALRCCRFIAATPVAASCQFFVKHFIPDITFFDEAGRARELTTLIPAALFSRILIFLGDPRQSAPHVSYEGEHQFSKQLKVSLLERAVHKGIPAVDFSVNRRAYANLHQLTSKLFYDSSIVSLHDPEKLPEPVKHMRNYLDKLRGVSSPIPRLLVDLEDSKDIRIGSKSPENVAHRFWILPKLEALLNEKWFTDVSGKQPGKILVISPSRAQKERYEDAIAKWPSSIRCRVRATTVAKVQGAEADLVVFDIVKGSDWIDDKGRLSVALSRAIQGEIILMSHRMSSEIKTKEGRARSVYLSQLWHECSTQDQILSGERGGYCVGDDDY